jgi:hypothetical protein
VRAILEKASRHLSQEHLLLVFDQFEEFLLIGEQNPERVKTLAELLESLQQDRIDRVFILLVVRSDYLVRLQELLRKAKLPPLRQHENWQEVTAFSERHARDFLDKSGLQLGPSLTDDVFREIDRIEGTQGLVRPITLNMVGLVLDRHAISREQSLPARRIRGGLVLDYLSSCIGRSEVRDHARHVLRHMITPEATKRPRSLSELAGETEFPEPVVNGCLTLMEKDGLVRLVDESKNVWEISHDFVARLLATVLARPGWLQVVRPWLTPAALAIWVASLALAYSYRPWYMNLTVEQIRGLDTSFVTEEGMSPLHFAASIDDAKAAKYLLARGAPIEDNKYGDLKMTPLRLATEDDHLAVVRVLLDGGANIEAIDRDGGTSLHRAAVKGEDKTVGLLLERGANPDARDKYNHTPLFSAAYRGHVKVAELLLQLTGNYSRRRADIEAKDIYGMTPLHVAAMRDFPAIVKLLLDQGADPLIRDDYGHVPWDYAMKNPGGKSAQILCDAECRADTIPR